MNSKISFSQRIRKNGVRINVSINKQKFAIKDAQERFEKEKRKYKSLKGIRKFFLVFNAKYNLYKAEKNYIKNKQDLSLLENRSVIINS